MYQANNVFCLLVVFVSCHYVTNTVFGIIFFFVKFSTKEIFTVFYKKGRYILRGNYCQRQNLLVVTLRSHCSFMYLFPI